MVGRGRFTIRGIFFLKGSCANRPARCAAHGPHNLKEFGLFVRQTLPILAEWLDGDGTPAPKKHQRPETAPYITKILYLCPFRKWIAGTVNAGDLNLRIY
jgi:hypothetical protein